MGSESEQQRATAVASASIRERRTTTSVRTNSVANVNGGKCGGERWLWVCFGSWFFGVLSDLITNPSRKGDK